MTESMGPIQDRTQEHLGPGDWTIATARKPLLQAARDLSQRGVVPPTVDQPELYETRSGRIVLPRNVDWVEATEQNRKAFTGVVAPSGRSGLGEERGPLFARIEPLAAYLTAVLLGQEDRGGTERLLELPFSGR